MNVLHAVDHYSPDFFQGFVRAHGTDGTALYKYVALSQEFDSLGNLRQYQRKARKDRTFKVLPSGPMILCLLFTNRSLFRTRFPILMISHAMLSSKILTACPTATPRARSLTRSRALRMMYGSNVLRVVRTDIEP